MDYCKKYFFIPLAALFILLMGTDQGFADTNWSQWHGPADGTAYLPQAPGPNLYRAWHLDMMDPHKDYSFTDNLGFVVDEVYHIGTLARADEQAVYLKLNADYSRLPIHTVWKIDSAAGERLWGSSQASGEDTTAPRTFQLYNSPQGFKALHAASFYGSAWNVYDVDTQQEYLISGIADSHSCLGAQILMDKWAWRNNQFRSAHSISYYHGGQLRWWNGTNYDIKITEPMTLIDFAWDDNKCVIFALSGFHVEGTPYDYARYLVLDKNGQIIQDSSISDIYRPNCPAYWMPFNTDIVMRLSVKGNYIYAIERKTINENRLVCRDINQNFAVCGEVSLGTTTVNRGISYCVDNNAVYIQFTDKIKAYSLDLSTVLWERTIPKRTLWHSDIQGFAYTTEPCTRNYPQQTIACDGTYIYHTTDNRFQVCKASDGALVYEYIFIDLPHKRTTQYGNSRVIGAAGDVVLMPNCVLVSSCLDSSYLWAFCVNPNSGQPPKLKKPQDTVVYINQPLCIQMYIDSGIGPYLWIIDSATDDSIKNILTVNEFNQVVGWIPKEEDIGKIFAVSVTVITPNGSDTKSFNISVQSSPSRRKLIDFSGTTGNDQTNEPGFDKPFFSSMYRTNDVPGGLYITNNTSAYCGVEGMGRYFNTGDTIDAIFYNKGVSSISLRPFISFIYKGKYNQYDNLTKIKLIPMGAFSIGAGKTMVKSFTLTESDAGFYTLVNLVPYVYSGTAADLIIDKIELLGPADMGMPLAVISTDVTIGEVPLTVTFDGAGSIDYNGTIEKYQWDFGDGSISYEIKPQHTYTKTGTFSITLTVTDNNGLIASANKVITVNLSNSPPVAYTQSITVVQNSQTAIYLTASDADADQLTYEIVQPALQGIVNGINGANTWRYIPEKDYQGEDSFTFRVFDGKVYSNTAVVLITVVGDDKVLGDINNDGKVDVLDLQLCVNVVLGIEAREEIVNKAKQVTAPLEECNVLDIQAVVNEILNSV